MAGADFRVGSYHTRPGPAESGPAPRSVPAGDVLGERFAAGNDQQSVRLFAGNGDLLSLGLGGISHLHFFEPFQMGARSKIAEEREAVGGFNDSAVCAVGVLGKSQWEVAERRYDPDGATASRERSGASNDESLMIAATWRGNSRLRIRRSKLAEIGWARFR